MKILITGALGHIGSKLIRELPKVFADLELTLLDNLATQRYCSLFNLPKNAYYKFIEENILNIELDEIIKSTDLVIHLAAMTDASASMQEPEQVYNNNYAATEKIATICTRHKVRLFFPSSTSVYGPATATIDEDCSNSSLNPNSPYAKCKLKEEQLLLQLNKNQKLAVAICRFGTIFGVSAGMRFHTAVNKFCWQAVMGQPLSVWETAYKQQRPYLSLHDAIDAICFLIKQDLFAGEIYNVVTCNSTVEEVIENIKHLIPSTQIKLVQNSIMNNLSFAVINKKLIEKNFKFSGNLTTEVAETIELLRNSHNIN